jgi:DNA polymerase III subunit delta
MPPKKSASINGEPYVVPQPKGAARMFLVHGVDDLSATRKADEIVHRLCPPEEQAFGLETLDPDPDLNADAVCAFLRNAMEALLTPPFLGGAKTVYVRNAPFFNPMTEPGKFSSVKSETDRLVALLKNGLPNGVHLVLLTSSVHKATSFYKTFQSLGEVHAFDAADKDKASEAEFLPHVQRLLADHGLSMPGDVLSVFLDRSGFALRQVTSEIEKLSLFLGDRKKVTLEDVYLMVAPIREGKFWEFADAFCTGELAPALRVMHRLLGQGESAVGLMVSLENRLRELLVMADCLKRGWARLSGGEKWRKLDWHLPPDGEELLSSLEKDPRKGHPFAQAKMAAQAARFPAGRWFKWLNAAVDAHAAMTGGDAVDPELALELFTTRTLGELAVAPSHKT